MEKEQKLFVEYLKKVSPGTSFRVVLDDLMRSGRGAIIAVHAPGMESILEGGFKINAKFTSQKLFELCKMDGAVILSPDMKKILYANTVLNPGTGIKSP